MAATYARARQLCEHQATVAPFPALFGLWRSSHVWGSYRRASWGQLVALANKRVTLPDSWKPMVHWGRRSAFRVR